LSHARADQQAEAGPDASALVLTLRYGELMSEAAVKWCDEFERSATPEVTPTGRRRWRQRASLLCPPRKMNTSTRLDRMDAGQSALVLLMVPVSRSSTRMVRKKTAHTMMMSFVARRSSACSGLVGYAIAFVKTIGGVFGGLVAFALQGVEHTRCTPTADPGSSS